MVDFGSALNTYGQNKNDIAKEVLFDLLKDPSAFYETSEVPTALDIAETLTLCRLQLETYQNSFREQSPDLRLEVIHALNSVSASIHLLYEQLRALPNKESSLGQLVKNYIVSHLLTFPKEAAGDSLDFLNLQLDDERSIRQDIESIIIEIDHARETWRAKNTAITHEEPGLLIDSSSATAFRAGVGFFAGRDNGLAGAVSDIPIQLEGTGFIV